ncbi:transcription factor bHLH143-like [Mangifera indica]|uniref:transcription factor bHLH143-like n=1 Tax=Mangifera indica TaxID=29780 RepID=UPI001CFB68EB|nr:transcription factor bHLH143-like [Mangifera indica]
MVKPHESWLYSQHSTWQLPDLNCMSTSLDPGQPECLPPCINPGTYMFSVNKPLPGFAVPGLAKLKTEPANGAHRLLEALPSQLQAVVPNMSPNPNEKQSAFTFGFSGEAIANDMFRSSQKGFLVFDQSGHQTRLIYSSFCPSVLNPPASLRKLGSFCGLHENQAIKSDEFTPLKAALHEESDVNSISGEENEMHEDTEEINALLYSDEDSDCSDDDEVKSTDHSPLQIEVSNKKREHIVEISEEVGSSDSPNKRLKLFDGVYRKASQTDTACSVKLEETHEYDNDTESSCANDQTQGEEVGFIMSNEQCIKDKIRKTLRILQSIIPSVKGKDPLLVLDEAIDYLQSLKVKANALGV